MRLPYTSILATVDSSDEAEAVIRAAAAFAVSYQAELSLVYVMKMPPVNLETAFGPYRDDFMAGADARLVELKKKAGVNAPHSILGGPVADAMTKPCASAPTSSSPTAAKCLALSAACGRIYIPSSATPLARAEYLKSPRKAGGFHPALRQRPQLLWPAPYPIGEFQALADGTVSAPKTAKS